MNYIILAAGKGSRLHPITLKHPKSLFRLDNDSTVLQRMIDLIKDADPLGKIIVVNGFMKSAIEKAIADQDVTFIHNPFYEVTNSIASLWFAKEYLKDEVTIFNGDIVVSKALMTDIVTKKTVKPLVLMDGSILKDGDYNVQVNDNKVVVMSKELTHFDGEYAGITKLDPSSAVMLLNKIEHMLESGLYDQWYENALVQMIFEENFNLYYEDISKYEWTEVDEVNDLVYAKRIHYKEQSL